ncbi:hypothetical protein MMC08_002427 [Hypocenomyce scalaris]|nr:hypothetical protein [Hypocenomyce scalaris]
MSSYLSTLLSNTTSRYTTLRRALLSSDSEEHDATIDNEDDSHISRVLRAYYTEKGRPFPPWLGPDPRTAQQQAIPAVSGAGYGSQSYSTTGGQRGSGSGQGRLSDLWADQPATPPVEESLSLRRPGQWRGSQRSGAAIPQRLAPNTEPANVRPLPSQRAGSYQGQAPSFRQASNPSPPPSSGSGTSVQERLKARLGGGRAASPGLGAGPSPPLNNVGSGTGNPYEERGGGPSGGGGGGSGRMGGAYEGRGNAYDDPGGAYGTSGGGSGGGGKPYMAASSPWVSGDGTYGGEGAGGQGLDRRRMGLPSGPRPSR